MVFLDHFPNELVTQLSFFLPPALYLLSWGSVHNPCGQLDPKVKHVLFPGRAPGYLILLTAARTDDCPV